MTPVTGMHHPEDAAVVVGIESYHALPPVPFAEADASAFADLLERARGVPAHRVHLLLGAVTRESLLRAFDAAAGELGPDGTLWVYFAGHGAASPVDGGRMLLGVDAQTDLAAFEGRAVTLRELELRSRTVPGRVVAVADACYGGAGRTGETLLAGTRFAVPVYATEARDRFVVWSAASANELSGPHPTLHHGAFTALVLEALAGGADGATGAAPDGAVTLGEAEARVREGLAALGVPQTPVLEAGEAARTAVVVRGRLAGAGPVGRGDDVFLPPPAVPGPPPAGWTRGSEAHRAGRWFVVTDDVAWDARSGRTWLRAPLWGDPQALAVACAEARTDGGGWRVPGVVELGALLTPRPDVRVFDVSGPLATSTPTPSDGVRYVLAESGAAGDLGRDSQAGTLCVRGGEPVHAPAEALEGAPDWLALQAELLDRPADRTADPDLVFGDRGITERRTGRAWTGFGGPAVGRAEALEACETQALADRRPWRLPWIGELERLVGRAPADRLGGGEGAVWSGTRGPGGGWLVLDLRDGATRELADTELASVWCAALPSP